MNKRELFAAYDEWAEEREALSAAEDAGAADSDAWETSDRRAVELLHIAVSFIN